MPILNYTTSIDPNRTVAEIQKMLVAKGARGIGIEYDANGAPSAVAFHIVAQEQPLSYRLPCRADRVQAVLTKQWRAGKVDRRYTTIQQANRVAWRIVKDWIEAQMAFVESEMVDMAEVFMPYQLMSGGQTMYEVMQHRLLAGPVEE